MKTLSRLVLPALLLASAGSAAQAPAPSIPDIHLRPAEAGWRVEYRFPGPVSEFFLLRNPDDSRGREWRSADLRSQLVASSVLQAGRRSEDLGFQSRLDWLMGKGWRQQLYLLHLGDGLELNDIGYLERNDFNYLRYELARREDAPPEDSRYASWETRWAASTRRNTSGLRIAEAAALQRAGELRDGGNEFWEVAMWSAGHDDRLT